jgi:xanthine dehydrogenase accessory factor
MNTVLDTVESWVRRGDLVALATVVATKNSAPQPVGTKMAINGSAQICGAVSGGCVEGAVVEVAELVLAGAPPRLVHYGIADEDAWDVGLPCGGEISVWIEAYGGDGLQDRFLHYGRTDGRAALVTAVDGTAEPGARLLVADGEESVGSLGDSRLDATAIALAKGAMISEQSVLVGPLADHGARLFVDVVAPPPRLIIVGAIDFAVPLSEAAALAGWRACVVDPRARFATAERFPAAERVIAAWPQEAFAQLQPIDARTSIAVLTHDPKLDDAALAAALASGASYIGAMGSRGAQERRHERLVAAGVAPEQLERISAPIGLDLGAMTSAETAISIMGEIVALRHGRSGGRLINGSGRIHAGVSLANC